MKKYLLVNSITTASLILGLTAIIFAVNNDLHSSFACALLAFFFDSTDGYLARLLNAESRLGAIFDSLADFIVYLIYPAVLFYYALGINNTTGIFFIALFLAAGIFRLLRFTATGFLENDGKLYYLGMPVFFSHFVILIILIVNFLNKALLPVVCPLLLGTMSLMMATKLKFRKPTSVYLGIFMCVIFIISLSLFFL